MEFFFNFPSIIPGRHKSDDMKALVFVVAREKDGWCFAECMAHNLFKPGDTWNDVRNNIEKPCMAVSPANKPP